MIVSWLALVVTLWFLPWVPVKACLKGAVGCVPSLPLLTSRHIFAFLPSTPLRSIAWQASKVVGAVTAVPVLGLAAMSGLALGAHCWFWLRRGVVRAVSSSEFWKHTVMLGTSLGLFGTLPLLASEIMGPAHDSKMQASYLLGTLSENSTSSQYSPCKVLALDSVAVNLSGSYNSVLLWLALLTALCTWWIARSAVSCLG